MNERPTKPLLPLIALAWILRVESAIIIFFCAIDIARRGLTCGFQGNGAALGVALGLTIGSLSFIFTARGKAKGAAVLATMLLSFIYLVGFLVAVTSSR